MAERRYIGMRDVLPPFRLKSCVVALHIGVVLVQLVFTRSAVMGQSAASTASLLRAGAAVYAAGEEAVLFLY